MATGHAGHADEVEGRHAGGDSRSPGADAGRRAHFGAFYGLIPPRADAPLCLVHGNCQAESLRIAIDGPDLAGIRIPPVHELTAEDLPHLEALLARADVLITQPIRSGYRGLALGSAELAAQLRPTATVLTVPVIRFAGLYPFQVIIRPPSDPSLVPPVVPYHDLRTLVGAAGLGGLPPLTPARVRAVADHSRDQLRRRERAHATVTVSDLFDTPSFDQMRTINHPGNAVWEPLAARVRTALGLGAPVPLERPLLDAIHAPREAAVIEAFALTDSVIPAWRLAGRPVDAAVLEAAHLAWYRDHPGAVAAGLERHAEVLDILSGT